MQPNERLIVAADFRPAQGVRDSAASVWDQTITFAEKIRDLGVILKVNSALRAEGHPLVKQLHERGVRVMADLKLCDIPETMETDALILRAEMPELLTVMTDAGVEGLRRVQQTLPGTEVLAVTVLTSIDNADCHRLHGRDVEATIALRIAIAYDAELKGIVCAAADLKGPNGVLAREYRLATVTPGIRPAWTEVVGDDQKRTMTVGEAIGAGATRIVIGRPIVRASDPRAAVLRTIDEIAAAL